jgi:hypothetical protein
LTDWEITVPPGAACSSSRAAHRIAEQPGPRREHGALMNRHAQRDRHRVSDAGCRRGAMREPGPLQGIGDLLEFQQRAVTAQVADLPAAPLRLGLHDVLVEGGPAIQSARLVVGHQSRVPHDIGEHDHGMVTFSVPAGARRACRWLHISLRVSN